MGGETRHLRRRVARGGRKGFGVKREFANGWKRVRQCKVHTSLVNTKKQ